MTLKPNSVGLGTVVFCDSSIREACYKFLDEDDVVCPYDSPVTNNVGEYRAVTLAFEQVIKRGYTRAIIYTDSQLVVFQTNGIDDQGRKWKKCKPHLQPLRDNLREILDKHPLYMLQWIPRELNPAGKALEILRNWRR